MAEKQLGAPDIIEAFRQQLDYAREAADDASNSIDYYNRLHQRERKRWEKTRERLEEDLATVRRERSRLVHELSALASAADTLRQALESAQRFLAEKGLSVEFKRTEQTEDDGVDW
jgi:chromosome segregation ATPase